jgi:glycogen operon protein
MHLCFYNEASDSAPAFEIVLDPVKNKTGDIWHCHIENLGPDTLYLWRVEGPFNPKEGLRFNPNLALIDPYAKALTDGKIELGAALAYDPASLLADLSFSKTRNDSGMPKCVVVSDDFDWQGDAPLNYPLKDCVIYETHVRGLTRTLNGSMTQGDKRQGLPPVAHPGTYRGVVEMISYFHDLGITSLEFLPVQEFDSEERFLKNPRTGENLSNYWGYSPIAFFAPKTAYACQETEPCPSSNSNGDYSLPVREFKYMVRELHAAGIEVILDVVFNHTAEGNELGPTIGFRGLDNPIYYILDSDKRHYKNYSGCGNTMNCNHPVTRTFIRECLRYWVVQMHVDGFRFDLGSILGRDANGNLLENPPVIESIAEDPILSDTKIIAEAWDAGGAYQVGSFPGGRWAEWNDKFRDDIRKFWLGEKASAVHLATRITGSSDLFLRDGRKPFHSINFITAHDGFTVNDLVSYTSKHNGENGEDNKDGASANWSFNCGAEGPTVNGAIEELRNRHVKNFLATLLLSIGTPLLLGGDEIRRTQNGNNNAYCQDNEISWYDWDLLEKHRDIFRFCSRLIKFRKRHPAFRRGEFYTGMDTDKNSLPDITWFDETGLSPDWSKLDTTLAARIDGSKDEIGSAVGDYDFFVFFNSKNSAVNFVIPAHPKKLQWRLVMDTGLPAPRDFQDQSSSFGPEVRDSYVLVPKSMALLAAIPESSA